MKAKLVRTGKSMTCSPHSSSRRTVRWRTRPLPATSSAFPIHGTLRIGDTLTEGEDLTFVGVPSFAPEIVRRVRLTDAMKAKKLKEALQQMSEEASCRCSAPRRRAGAGRVVAAAARRAEGALDAEYSCRSSSRYRIQLARWISSGRPQELEAFISANGSGVADDVVRSGVSGQERVLSRLHQGTRRGIVFSSIKRREEEGVRRLLRSVAEISGHLSVSYREGGYPVRRASRLHRWRLWNTGSPACAGDEVGWHARGFASCSGAHIML